MSYIQQHIEDHCKTAQDVREAAQRVARFRDRFKRFKPTVPSVVLPPEPAPIPLDEPPELPVPRDWLIISPYHDRTTRWPSGFIDRIKSMVAQEFSVTVIDLSAARRDHQIIVPRHIAIYLCRTLTLKSLPEIGRRFGDRDHTTILSAVRKTEKRMCTDRWICQIVVDLQLKLENDLHKWRSFSYETANRKIADAIAYP